MKRPAFTTDGRVRLTRVVRRGRAVTRAAARVTCTRKVGHLAIPCGWTWWSVHPALVFMAKAHPNHVLLRRHQQPPDHPGRKGHSKHAEWD